MLGIFCRFIHLINILNKLEFLKRINTKLILTLCLAGFLLIFASSIIGYINDIELATFVEKNGVNEAMKQLGAERLSNYTIWFYISTLIGLLVSTLISSFIILKKKLLWINSTLVFLGLLFLNFLNLYRLEYTKYVVYLMNYGLVINVVIFSSIFMLLSFVSYYYSFRIKKK